MTSIYAPCTAWITAEEAAAFCGVEGSDAARLADYALEASQLLFELSGRQFNGVCDDVIRPCQVGCGCWGSGLAGIGYGILSPGAYPEAWGYGAGFQWGGAGWINDSGEPCGCGYLSQVDLPGYPIGEITEVKIDGAIIPDTEYRVDENRFLVRVRADADEQPPFWPACQILDLPDTEPGTWSVAYTYGVMPPQPGIQAAKQLACELYRADANGQCAIPSRTSRINRAGVQVDMLVLNWLDGQNTGLIHIDSFLNAYNPQRLRRRAGFFSPDHPRFGRHVGGS